MVARRQDLKALVNAYLNALCARDPGRLPLTPDFRYTENCQELPPGEGLWKTCTGNLTYRLAMIDAEEDQAGLFAVLTENGVPCFLALRLKAARNQLCEAEALVARWGNPLWAPEALTQPRPELVEAVPLDDPGSRDQAVALANAYFDAVELDDGGLVALDPGCTRITNGVQTTLNEAGDGIHRLPAQEGLSSGFFSYVSEIRDRRFPIYDEVTGVTMGIAVFDHPAVVRSVVVQGVGAQQLPACFQKPSSAVAFEAFKVQGGRIRQIEAVEEFLPYGMRTGWA